MKGETALPAAKPSFRLRYVYIVSDGLAEFPGAFSI